MATCGLAGGTQIATREPSPRRASRTGVVAGSSPKGRAIWIAARSSAAAVQRGRGDLAQSAVAFEPHIARPVDHDFAHVRVVERRLKPRQKRFQEVQPVALAHSWPFCFAVQVRQVAVEVIGLQVDAARRERLHAVVRQTDRLTVPEQAKSRG